VNPSSRILWIGLTLFAGCGSKTGLTIGDDATVEPRPDAGLPPPGCPAHPNAPTDLLVDESLRPASLGVRGEVLFVGAVDQRPLTEMQTGGLHRMSVRGGPATRVELDAPFYGGGLRVTPELLVYHEVRAERTGGASWAFSYPSVVVEADGSMTRVLVTELEDDAGRAAAFAMLGDDRLVFGRHRAAPETMRGDVSIYDRVTGEERVLVRDRDLRRAVGAGETVYLYEYVDGGGGRLSRVDSDLEVVELETLDEFSCCWLWAADDDGLFFKRGRSVERWPVDGAPVTIAESEARIVRAAVDDRFLYWAEGADILYVDKRGGPVETLVEGGTSYIEDLVTDGCALFWSAVNPPRVLVRAVP
jgi:hypothetical protein